MIPVVKPSMPPMDEFFEEIKDMWDTKILTHSGPKHQLLEKKLETYLDVNNVSLFANGHLALELAIESLKLTGEIITTPFTFSSTTQAIVRNHLKPVFCDIRDDFYTIDVSKIEELITPDTSAILPVHVYGNVCDVEEIDILAKKYNLKIIYDAAHAFGEKVFDKSIGSFGDISMFSFHATKVFNTIEGGCLTYNDDNRKSLLAQLRQFGMNGQESVPIIGTNAKMTEMNAAMGLCNLKYIDNEIKIRKELVNTYNNRLFGVKGLNINKKQKMVKSNYAYFPIVLDGYKKTRNQVCEELASIGVLARKYFYPLTNTFKCYENLFSPGNTPIAKNIAQNVLCLPLYTELTSDDINYICDQILK